MCSRCVAWVIAPAVHARRHLQQPPTHPCAHSIAPQSTPWPPSQEFKCEICGNDSYWGRRAFERHFKEWRHQNGMKSLGIPNTRDFFEIVKIEDAQALWRTLQTRNVSGVEGLAGLWVCVAGLCGCRIVERGAFSEAVHIGDVQAVWRTLHLCKVNGSGGARLARRGRACMIGGLYARGARSLMPVSPKRSRTLHSLPHLPSCTADGRLQP